MGASGRLFGGRGGARYFVAKFSEPGTHLPDRDHCERRLGQAPRKERLAAPQRHRTDLDQNLVQEAGVVKLTGEMGVQRFTRALLALRGLPAWSSHFSMVFLEQGLSTRRLSVCLLLLMDNHCSPSPHGACVSGTALIASTRRSLRPPLAPGVLSHDAASPDRLRRGAQSTWCERSAGRLIYTWAFFTTAAVHHPLRIQCL